MERSPHYDESIARIKQEHREGAPLAESREKISHLRQEMILDNAQCARLLTEFIDDNPAATVEQFKEYAQGTNLIIHPEITANFIANLSIDRNRTKRAITTLNKSKQAGEALFRWLVPDWDNTSNQDPITIEAYPLSVVAYLSDSDFHKVDTRTNVGGFYNDRLEYERKKFPWGKEEDSCPVIIVDRDTARPTTTEHEKGHAENKNFQKAVEHRAVWVRMKPQLKNLRIETGGDYQELLKNLMANALSNAKNELLADLKAQPNLWNKMQDLLQRGGVYDYFQHNYQLAPEIYDEMWENYSQILNRSFQAIDAIMGIYQHLGLEERGQLFRWVLAQFPIDEWPEELEKSGFSPEARALEKVGEDRYVLAKLADQEVKNGVWRPRFIDKKIEGSMFVASVLENPEEATQTWKNVDIADAAVDKLKGQLQANQIKPLWVFLDQYNQEIAGLIPTDEDGPQTPEE